MRFLRLSPALVFLHLLCASLVMPVRSDGAGPGMPHHPGALYPDSLFPQSVEAFDDTFYAVRPLAPGFLSHRDIQFMVDQQYSYQDYDGTVGLSRDQRSVLDTLASNIAEKTGLTSPNYS